MYNVCSSRKGDCFQEEESGKGICPHWQIKTKLDFKDTSKTKKKKKKSIVQQPCHCMSMNNLNRRPRVMIITSTNTKVTCWSLPAVTKPNPRISIMRRTEITPVENGSSTKEQGADLQSQPHHIFSHFGLTGFFSAGFRSWTTGEGAAVTGSGADWAGSACCPCSIMSSNPFKDMISSCRKGPELASVVSSTSPEEDKLH